MANWWDQYANLGPLSPYTWGGEIGASGNIANNTGYGTQAYIDSLAGGRGIEPFYGRGQLDYGAGQMALAPRDGHYTAQFSPGQGGAPNQGDGYWQADYNEAGEMINAPFWKENKSTFQAVAPAVGVFLAALGGAAFLNGGLGGFGGLGTGGVELAGSTAGTTLTGGAVTASGTGGLGLSAAEFGGLGYGTSGLGGLGSGVSWLAPEFASAAGTAGGAAVTGMLPNLTGSALLGGAGELLPALSGDTFASGAGSIFGSLSNVKDLFNIGTGLYGLLSSDNVKDAANRNDPWGSLGGRDLASTKLMELLSKPGSIARWPGMEHGMQAVQRVGAAQGWTGSGNMAAGLLQFGNSFYNDALKTLAPLAGAGAPTSPVDVQKGLTSSQTQVGQSLELLGKGFGQLGTKLGWWS